MIAEQLNKTMEGLENYLEHTNLKPQATIKEIETLCKEANENGFAAVCVNPYFVKTARKVLGEASNVKLVTVVGFPFGYSNVSAKVEETKKAILEGADEIDMVMNLSALRNNDLQVLRNDIDSVNTYCHLHNKILKCIIETSELSNMELKIAADLCAEIGVDYVKTSTGYGKGGATVEAVEILRKLLPEKIKIKASGGINNLKQALQLIQAGATRIGSSSCLKIYRENV